MSDLREIAQEIFCMANCLIGHLVTMKTIFVTISFSQKSYLVSLLWLHLGLCLQYDKQALPTSNPTHYLLF